MSFSLFGEQAPLLWQLLHPCRSCGGAGAVLPGAQGGNSSGWLNDMRCPIKGSACTQLWVFIAQIPKPVLKAWQITITCTVFTAEVGNRFFLHLFHQKMKSFFNIKLYSESLHPRTSSDSSLLFPGTGFPVTWSQPGSKGCSPAALPTACQLPKCTILWICY